MCSEDKKNVIVFDIDGTLCFGDYYIKSLSSLPNSLKNTLAVSGSQEHLFPHFKFLVNYLLRQHETRIAIFSVAEKERNIPLISEIFSHLFGAQCVYNHLIHDGQFEVFSHHQLDKYNNKDLTRVLRHNETLNDIILVDDNIHPAASDQRVMIQTPPTSFLTFGYYFIGLFKSYFENENYCSVSLREFMSSFIETNGCVPTPTEDFSLRMIVIGLEEVRKVEPETIIWK
jgi:hypothetical protein